MFLDNPHDAVMMRRIASVTTVSRVKKAHTPNKGFTTFTDHGWMATWRNTSAGIQTDVSQELRKLINLTKAERDAPTTAGLPLEQKHVLESKDRNDRANNASSAVSRNAICSSRSVDAACNKWANSV